jgi:uncharacterized protein
VSATEPPAGGTTRGCPNCGWEPQTPDDTRCANCGTHLQPSPAVADSTTDLSTPQEQRTFEPAVGATRLPSSVRNWGMAAHLAAFSVFVVPIPALGPLLVWLLKREDHPFIEGHSKEAVNFNLSVLVYGIVAAFLILLAIGLLLLPIIGVAWLVLTIIAAVRAANGEDYRYPLTIRFIT